MNWNVFTRKTGIWAILLLVFLFICLIGSLFIELCGREEAYEMSDSTIRMWTRRMVLVAIGACAALYPFLKKRLVGSKYPLKRATIRSKDLAIGDIITFPDRECVFEGLYHGEYLFAPMGELKGEEDYIKLRKKQIPMSVRKVVSPEYGLKWVSPVEVCIDDSTNKLVEEK